MLISRSSDHLTSDLTEMVEVGKGSVQVGTEVEVLAAPGEGEPRTMKVIDRCGIFVQSLGSIPAMRSGNKRRVSSMRLDETLSSCATHRPEPYPTMRKASLSRQRYLLSAR